MAHTFNFAALPSPVRRPVFSWALSDVDRFVVFSTVEKNVYSDAFQLPTDRFDVVLWGAGKPEVERPDSPFEEGPYVSAIGGNARDYATLVAAAKQLPEIRFVIVARPESLAGLRVPSNVTVHVNLPWGETMNVLQHSRFMVLPLATSEVPCGHVTLVAAMHLGKAFVVTDSAGVRDYAVDGTNALTVPPRSPSALKDAISRLWNDSDLCRTLGENGRRFATEKCTEESIARHFIALLEHGGILRPQAEA